MKPLQEGLVDAGGFIAGALAGYALGKLLGWDIFSAGYTATSIAAILLVGLGGGAGVQLARRFSRRRKDS
jgi:hypothetical protein